MKKNICLLLGMLLLFLINTASYAEKIQLNAVEKKNATEVTASDIKEAIKVNSLSSFSKCDKIENSVDKNGKKFSELVDVSLTVQGKKDDLIVFSGLSLTDEKTMYAALYEESSDSVEITSTTKGSLISSIMFNYEEAAKIITDSGIGKPTELEHMSFGTIITTGSGKYVYTEQECIDAYGKKIDSDYYELESNTVYTYNDYMLWFNTNEKNHDAWEKSKTDATISKTDVNQETVTDKKTDTKEEDTAPDMTTDKPEEIKQDTDKKDNTLKNENTETTIIASEWAKDSIAQAKSEGWLSTGDFKDDYLKNITRDRFCDVAFAGLLKHNYKPDSQDSNPFTDVSSPTVSALFYAGIINGKSDTIFAPDNNITREEAATILYRMAKYMKLNMPIVSDDIHYNDEDSISDWAVIGVKALNAMDVMNGVEGNKFAPNDTYTIEQAITTMVRLYEYK